MINVSEFMKNNKAPHFQQMAYNALTTGTVSSAIYGPARPASSNQNFLTYTNLQSKLHYIARHMRIFHFLKEFTIFPQPLKKRYTEIFGFVKRSFEVVLKVALGKAFID